MLCLETKLGDGLGSKSSEMGGGANGVLNYARESGDEMESQARRWCTDVFRKEALF